MYNEQNTLELRVGQPKTKIKGQLEATTISSYISLDNNFGDLSKM